MTDIDFTLLAQDGARLALDMGLGVKDRRSCVWALLVDAAKTERAMPKDGPRGLPSASAMPESQLSAWERAWIEVEWANEQITPKTALRYQPSARSIDNWMTVTRLLQLRHHTDIAKNPRQARDAVWLYAHGVSATKIARARGFRRELIYDWRKRICGNIERAIYLRENLAA
ncbi:MAG: hypothetical protein AAFU68_02785 [Pseudomonadota bacterium]